MQDQQDPEDSRGRGGKAPRSKRGKGSSSQPAAGAAGAGAGGQHTPSRGLLGTTFSYLRSPLTAAAQVARGVGALLGTPLGHAAEPTSNGQEQPAAANHAPAQPAPTVIAPAGPSTLAALPPALPPIQVAPAAVAQPTTGTQQVTAAAPAAAAVVAAQAQPATPTGNMILQARQREGWSPSKLSSLAHFLNNRNQQVSAPPAPPAAPQLSIVAAGADLQRPYLGLKHLLQAGLQGAPLPASWTSSSQQAHSMLMPAARPATSVAGRYQPYTFGNQSRLRQTDGIANTSSRPAGSGFAAVPTSPAPLALTPPPATSSRPTAGTPVASVPFRLMQTSAAAPSAMGTPTAGTASRHVALPRGPSVTPGAIAAPGALGGVSGQKRGRDAAEATPLMGSGIKNLAEYKRQRQRYTTQQQQQQQNRLLALTGSTPKDRDGRSRSTTASAGASPTSLEPSQEATPMQQAAAITAGAPQAGQVATETARKILESLDNWAKNKDAPTATAAKQLPNGTPKPNLMNQPGSTPYPRGQPPPLDRLTPLATPPSEAPVAFGLSAGSRDAYPTPRALLPKLAASVPSEAQPSSTAAGSGSGSDTPQQHMPSLVPGSVPAIDALAGLHAASRSRSVDKQAKSVRFAVPEDESAPPETAAPPSPKGTSQGGQLASLQPDNAVQQPAAAACEAAERQEAMQKAVSARTEAAGTGAAVAPTSGSVPATPMPKFTFGAAQEDADAVVQVVSKVLKTVDTQVVQVEHAPLFSFGTGAAAEQQTAGTQAAGPQPPVPTAVADQHDAAAPFRIEPSKAIQQQVLEAAAIPLPEDDEEVAEDTQHDAGASATQPGSEAQTAIAGEAQPAAAAAAAPAAGTWDTSFLQQNKLAAATNAAVEAIETAKTPTPAASETAATKFNFGMPASRAPAAAPPAPTAFHFGVPSSTEAAQASPPAATTTTAEPAAQASASEKADTSQVPASPVVTGGWGDAFLASNQSQLSSATRAVEQVIAESAQGGAGSTAPAFAFQPPAPATSTASSAGTSAASLSPVTFGNFSFGAPPSSPLPPAAAADTTTMFGFMSPAPTMPVAPQAASSAATTFPPAMSSFATPVQQTGAAASSPSMFPFANTPEPASTAGTAPSPQLTKPSSASAFGFGSQTTFNFGTNSTPPASSPAPSEQKFTFGVNSTPQQASSPSPFTFTTTPGPPENASTPPNPFQLTPAPAAAPATAPAWASAVTSSPTPSPAPAFPPASGTPFSFGAAASSIFGSQQQPQQQPQQPAPPFTFGVGSSTAFSFGAGGSTASFPFGAGASTPSAATPGPNTLGQPGSTPWPPGGAGTVPSPVPFGTAGGNYTPGGFGGLQTPPTLGQTGNASGFGAAAPSPIMFGAGQGSGTPAPAFGAGTPAAGQADGGGGLGMSMNDFKPATSERRKLHARRTRH